MANISECYGTLKIIADSVDAIDKILEIFENSCNSDYCTYVEAQRPLQVEKTDDDNYLYVSSFEGSGRWVYQNNVSNFGEWYADTSQASMLFHHYWKIIFNYTDYEPGCCVLYDAVDYIIHEKNTPFTRLIIDEETSKSYPFTLKNILEKGFEGGTFKEWVESRTSTYMQTRNEARIDLLDSYEDEMLDYFGNDRTKMLSFLNTALKGLPFKEA